MRLKLPDIVTGRVIPPAVQEKILKEEEKQKTIKGKIFDWIKHNILEIIAIIISLIALLKQ